MATAIKTLKALWTYREVVRQSERRDDWVTNAEKQFLSLINRLKGKPEGTAGANPPPKPALDSRRILALTTKLLELASLPPQPRGYAFEAWLKDEFDCFGLEAREPFRHRGEQIDSIFVLQGKTYLAEVKWQSEDWRGRLTRIPQEGGPEGSMGLRPLREQQ